MFRTYRAPETKSVDGEDLLFKTWAAKLVDSISSWPSAVARNTGLNDRLPSGVVGAVEAVFSRNVLSSVSTTDTGNWSILMSGLEFRSAGLDSSG
jgi:hypothetical protein